MMTTLDDLQHRNRTERYIFLRLLDQLSYDPLEAILAMAFWLWLEDSNGFKNIISCLKEVVSTNVLDDVAKEALFCMNSLGSETSIRSDYWLTSLITERPVPWWRVQCSKNATIARTKYLIENFCAPIFNDILYDFYRHEAGGDGLEVAYDDPIPVAGFPHPVFGEVRFLRLNPWQVFPADHLWDRN